MAPLAAHLRGRRRRRNHHRRQPRSRITSKIILIDDYLEFGIEKIWILDPALRRVSIADRVDSHRVRNGQMTVPGTVDPRRFTLSNYGHSPPKPDAISRLTPAEPNKTLLRSGARLARQSR